MIDFLMKKRNQYIGINLMDHYRYERFFLIEVWDKYIQGENVIESVYSDGVKKVYKYFVTIPIDKIISIEEIKEE